MIHAGYHQPRPAAMRLTASSHQLATSGGRNAARAWQRCNDAVTHVEIAPMKVSYDARSRQSAPKTCAAATDVSAAGRHMGARVLGARRRHRPG